MTNDILIIYPQDETTDFLQDIPNFLFDKHGKERFIYQRIGFSVKEHRSCINLIEKFSKNSLVIFLGHGRSDALLGAMDYERFDFITEEHIHIFKGKQVFFFSCRSEELLQGRGIEGIGFGHILSSPDELTDNDLRRQYSYLFSTLGMPDSPTINQFKKLLVNIVRESLHDHIARHLSNQELYFNLKLRLNKTIATLIQENEPAKVRNLVNLLFKAKTEIRLFI